MSVLNERQAAFISAISEASLLLGIEISQFSINDLEEPSDPRHFSWVSSSRSYELEPDAVIGSIEKHSI